MKKLTLLIAFAIFTIAVFAQTGIWGLSFNMKVADALKIMKDKGFTLSEESSNQLNYVNPNITNLDKVTLKLSPESDKLLAWKITYEGKGNSEFEDSIFDMLTDIHGTYSYYDDYWEEWVWELDNEMAIYLYIAGDGTIAIDYTEYFYDDYWW